MKALSEKTVLALYAMHFMLRKGKPASLAQISRSGRFAPEQVRTVFGKLQVGGLIRSRSGRGFVLAKAPGEISVLNVVQAVDDPKSPEAPCGGDYDACAVRATCLLALLCRSAEEAFQNSLRDFTLEDLADVSVDLPTCLDPDVRRRA